MTDTTKSELRAAATASLAAAMLRELERFYLDAPVRHIETSNEISALAAQAVKAAERDDTMLRAQRVADVYTLQYPKPAPDDAHRSGLLGDYDGQAQVGMALGSGTIDCCYINLHSPTQPQLLALMALLREHGFRRYQGGKPEDYPEVGRRAWIYEGNFRLQAFFPTGSDDAAVCRFVQTGEELQPVFGLRCDGEVLVPEVAS